MNFYLSRPHTQNWSQTTLKESNDVMDGDAKPLAFVQGAEEIMGLFFFSGVNIFLRQRKLFLERKHGKAT